jgi:predicted membrane-bound dolichyl-phosphate-mannose-protein mannosyltransferase
MAADNLLIVHGRIATLDIYVLAAMICGATLYLRGRPLWAGAAIGVGACFKLVAPFTLIVMALFELLSRGRRGRAPARAAALAACGLSAAVVFIGLLAVLDRIAPPYDPVTGHVLGGGPFAHLGHMVSYAAAAASPRGPAGIASYPWQWLFDFKPIVYLNVDLAHPAPGLYGIRPEVHFLGMISPPLLLMALPAIVLALLSVRRVQPRRLGRLLPPPSSPTLLGLAWVLGTLLSFELLSLVWGRTSYLYYMVIVMPGIYLLVAELALRLRSRPRLLVAWAFAVLAAAVVMYPLTPLP